MRTSPLGTASVTSPRRFWKSAFGPSGRADSTWRRRGPAGSNWSTRYLKVWSRSRPAGAFSPRSYDRFAQAEAWRIYDDVLPVLDKLAARGVRLAVISNWDERLRCLLGRLRLDSRFEAIVVSSEVGHAKPDRVIFDGAAEKVGLPASQILHIGDSAEMDLYGARAAGFKALQIRRGTATPGPDHLRSMLELPERLWPDLQGRLRPATA